MPGQRTASGANAAAHQRADTRADTRHRAQRRTAAGSDQAAGYRAGAPALSASRHRDKGQGPNQSSTKQGE